MTQEKAMTARPLRDAMLAELHARRATAPTGTSERCVECGHVKLNPWRGYCQHEVSPFGKRPGKYCGCSCVFPASTEPAGEPSTHRCNGVNDAERHGTQNKCTICGEYREGWYDSNGMEVRAPAPPVAQPAADPGRDAQDHGR